MEIISIEKQKHICDEIKFEVTGEKLAYVDFLLNKKPVLMEFKNTLTGLTIDEISAKIPRATINPEIMLILKELEAQLKKTIKNNNLKIGIYKLKNNNSPQV